MPDSPLPPESEAKPHSGGNFRQFFLRGLAILLPTVLTIWLLSVSYQFVQDRIAGPINDGVKALVAGYSPWPTPSDEDYDAAVEKMTQKQKDTWSVADGDLAASLGDAYTPTKRIQHRREWMRSQPQIEHAVRSAVVERWWNSYTVGTWAVMDLIGLVIAIVLIYIVGWLVGSFIGRRLYHKGEELIHRVPVIRSIYPSIKQVTDFFVGAKSGPQFSAVVAVEYPRKGLWSVGLVTGETMRNIQARAGQPCLTVFIPSSPTPFTGYVITVPKADTIDLPITIEEAIKFAVSGGVLIPPNQQIGGGGPKLFNDAGNPQASGGVPGGADQAPGGSADPPESTDPPAGGTQ
jgi:uncharacterized membrane protein